MNLVEISRGLKNESLFNKCNGSKFFMMGEYGFLIGFIELK